MILSFENMGVSKKVNYLFRKYEFSFEYMTFSQLASQPASQFHETIAKVYEREKRLLPQN